jgi:hypothetical protein
MFVEKSSENTAKDDGAKYDSAKYNERSFSTLIRALRLSQGYFSFVLVNCNSLALRQQIVDRLQATCAVKPQTTVFALFGHNSLQDNRCRSRRGTASSFNDPRFGISAGDRSIARFYQPTMQRIQQKIFLSRRLLGDG